MDCLPIAISFGDLFEFETNSNPSSPGALLGVKYKFYRYYPVAMTDWERLGRQRPIPPLSLRGKEFAEPQ